MKGDIYSDQRCPLCGSVFEHRREEGLFCPNHPEIQATRFKLFYPPDVWRRFTSYEKAYRFLNGLRFQADEGTFDSRDHKKDNPLGFSNLVDQYLEIRKDDVKSLDSIRDHLSKASAYFGGKNIKQIFYSDLEDFLMAKNATAKTILSKKDGSPLSAKTRNNVKASLHTFFVWIEKREKKNKAKFEMPEFPEVKFKLGWRGLVDKETQQAIIDEVRRISEHINPKIWIGVKWLATYIAIRPAELLSVREDDFNTDLGLVMIRDPKEGEPKIIPVLEEDIEIVKSFPRAIGNPYFFRHGKGRSGVADGERFGDKMFWKYWRLACRNLGITGVDLYGGTKHSSATALGEFFTPEEIKKATLHTTNKAFERYFRVSTENLRKMYRQAADRVLTGEKQSPKTSQVVSISKKS